MLIGGSYNKVDKKGRIFVPSRFKEDLGETIVLCNGVFGKNCLWGFSVEEFDKFTAKLNRLPYGKMQDMYRTLSSGAIFTELDASGRVLIPAELREFAGIGEEVRIIGMKTNIEIWSSEEWAKEQAKIKPEDFAAVIEELDFSLGD